MERKMILGEENPQKNKDKQKYIRPDLPHVHGGLIYRAFWLSSPMTQLGAHKRNLLNDAQQEMFIIALENSELKDKELMNATQRAAYAFWKNLGFRKVRTAQGSRWTFKEDPLPIGEEELSSKENPLTSNANKIASIILQEGVGGIVVGFASAITIHQLFDSFWNTLIPPEIKITVLDTNVTQVPVPKVLSSSLSFLSSILGCALTAKFNPIPNKKLTTTIGMLLAYIALYKTGNLGFLPNGGNNNNGGIVQPAPTNTINVQSVPTPVLPISEIPSTSDVVLFINNDGENEKLWQIAPNGPLLLYTFAKNMTIRNMPPDEGLTRDKYSEILAKQNGVVLNVPCLKPGVVAIYKPFHLGLLKDSDTVHVYYGNVTNSFYDVVDSHIRFVGAAKGEEWVNNTPKLLANLIQFVHPASGINDYQFCANLGNCGTCQNRCQHAYLKV